MSKGREIGIWGEDLACSFLERKGFKIVERNYHSTVGEIDIIAHKGGDFYFLEVKTRAEGPFAYDVAITFDKKRKLRKTINQYCLKRKIMDSGFILASVMVVYNRQSKKVNFRFAVIY